MKIVGYAKRRNQLHLWICLLWGGLLDWFENFYGPDAKE